VPGLVDDGIAQLASAVGGKVVEDHAIAAADWWWRFLAGRDNPGWHDEFVGDAAVIALRDQGHRVGRRRSARLNHGAIGALGPIPSLVAVHRVVTAADRGNPPGAD